MDTNEKVITAALVEDPHCAARKSHRNSRVLVARQVA
jgi:hypothetical protein